SNVQAALDTLTGTEGTERVPGIAVGIIENGEITTYCSGVANPLLETGVTADTLFRIASISKLYTATLVMQLVAEGVVDLDTPLVELLPEFKLKNDAETAAITTRHLLSHTSGIPGDFGFYGGRGDDAVQRYVAGLQDLRTVFRPGLI